MKRRSFLAAVAAALGFFPALAASPKSPTNRWGKNSKNFGRKYIIDPDTDEVLWLPEHFIPGDHVRFPGDRWAIVAWDHPDPVRRRLHLRWVDV